MIDEHRVDDSDNELRIQQALEDRGPALCLTMESQSFSGWRGRITEIDAAGDQAGVMLAIGDDDEIGTWNNTFSDFEHDTLLDPGSSLYEAVMEADEGDMYEVSGTFISRGDACVYETSITDSGSLNTPDFLVRFTKIEPVD